MSDRPQKHPIVKKEQQAVQRPFPDTPIDQAGQMANQIAGNTIFARYLSEKSANTIKRHARDLELFAEYLLDIGVMPTHGADFQTNPNAWQGITWGLVEGFVQWLLQEGYAVSTVNARLSTVRNYAQLAVKAGMIDRQEGMLIQSVKGFSRQNRHNVDNQREQTRKEEITYAYKPEGKKRTVVINRRSTKKDEATVIDEALAMDLKIIRNASPQAHRDALLMCILLEHGLRASEMALLKAHDFALDKGEFTFYRPKVKGTEHERATHKLTPETYQIARRYITEFHAPTLPPNAPLIVATTRLLKSGEGGMLRQNGLSRIRISERVAYLGKQLGVDHLSAHDCRHYCATRMARLGYGVDELMAWFGWTSAQTAVRYVTAVQVQERYKG